MSSNNSAENRPGKTEPDPVITFLGSVLGGRSFAVTGNRIQPKARAMAQDLEPEDLDKLRKAIGQRADNEGVSVTSGYISRLITPYHQGASAALAGGNRDMAVQALAAAEALGILGREQVEAERSAAEQQLAKERAAFYSEQR